MLYTLGLGGNGLEKEDVVDLRIKEMGREFDLIMIMEQFDESLVLMAKGKSFKKYFTMFDLTCAW